MKPVFDASSVLGFVDSMRESGSLQSRSVPGKPITLYGTCYGLLIDHYLERPRLPDESTANWVLSFQDPASGYFVGPELDGYRPSTTALHDRDHLLWHLTCAVLPVCSQFGWQLAHPLRDARKFCDLEVLSRWCRERDWKHAWFEGNNILFVGQMLLYMRDVEQIPEADQALSHWFSWLDRCVDWKTGLWGTDGACSDQEAVYGGYHQLLLYHHQNRSVTNPRGLVDTVLSLQNADGGFNPDGNAGACEDVDSVDLLVHCYKRVDYRRAEIRVALSRCLKHILKTQNDDGGFPYNRDTAQSHMGVPGTDADENQSCMFPTWFRVHTLALIKEILPDHPAIAATCFRFNDGFGMGWHGNPSRWTLSVTEGQRRKEQWIAAQKLPDQVALFANTKARRFKKRIRHYRQRAKAMLG